MRPLAQVMRLWMILWQHGKVKVVPGSVIALLIVNTSGLRDLSKTVDTVVL